MHFVLVANFQYQNMYIIIAELLKGTCKTAICSLMEVIQIYSPWTGDKYVFCKKNTEFNKNISLMLVKYNNNKDTDLSTGKTKANCG